MLLLLVLSSFAGTDLLLGSVAANSDQDGDGLSYGLEYLIGTQPNDWDSDNDNLPDGWEWLHGLDPTSSAGPDGALGDPDGDGFTNLQEYSYGAPAAWDNAGTTTLLDNGVWWNGTVPVRLWNEEDAMQYAQPGCGDAGSDGSGSIILCDEDPVGNICTDGFDNDRDGSVDSADPDNDGDADCSSNDDDGDGVEDEDVDGWDTDGDGMPDGWEASYGLDPTSASSTDGANGDPDGDGLINLYEYANPSWTTTCNGQPCWRPGPPTAAMTETTTPCNPSSLPPVGPGGCATLTAEVDGVTSTNPNVADTDGDGLNDSYEALILLTDPTAADTDNDGIDDGIEVGSAYGDPPLSSDPRNNNTDGDALDDGEEDTDGDGVLDLGETDPTRREDSGDFDGDGLENWEENLTCTDWDVADTDGGGVNDGDERNTSHGTDPCDSLEVVIVNVTSWNSGQARLSVDDDSAFDPEGGSAAYNLSGTLSTFTYTGKVNGVLLGVSPDPGSATQIHVTNGSWCHTSAVADGTKLTTRAYCDDDFEDTDGDRLADWQELLGTFGWFSNPSIVDSDADGVDDHAEVFNGTDPLEPCDNNLDTDGDGVNDYFETTTGCDLIYVGVLNGSSDLFITDPTDPDTDDGGINDRIEYLDGTNPQNVPTDDVQPDDFDGDGLPDAVENASGTDWRDPDTDGGGMLDGDECPPIYWLFDCEGAPFDPLDPSDDITNQDIIFYANNTTGAVDTDLTRYWRLQTFDVYTGTAYGLDASVHPAETIVIPYGNASAAPDAFFTSSIVGWELTYEQPQTGAVAHPAWMTNITTTAPNDARLTRTNVTFVHSVEQGALNAMGVEAPEGALEWSTLAPQSVVDGAFTYELDLPPSFSDANHPNSAVNNTTQSVIAGASNAYAQAEAIDDYLRNGSGSIVFQRNHNGSGVPNGEDLTRWMLTQSREGTCSEFVTTYVTMARLAGLPARKVSGYIGGDWTGSGYTVSNVHASTWAEVALRTDAANGNRSLGWVPFRACPDAAEVELVNLTFDTFSYPRDGSVELGLTGTFRYSNNTTAIDNVVLEGYLVDADETGAVPGPGAPVGQQFFANLSAIDGSVRLNGTVTVPVDPGQHRLMVVHRQSGYVSYGSILLEPWINVTDDSVLLHVGPDEVGFPWVGAGSTTTIDGQLDFNATPVSGSGSLGDPLSTPQQVWMNFTSSVDGVQNLTGDVRLDGSWSIEVTLDENETVGNLTATLGYSGWQDTLATPAPTYHLRPSTTQLILNVTEAPNLTATLEGPESNGSILVIDDLIYLNGSVLTVGPSPTPMPGSLALSLRENGTFEWTEVMVQPVNGSFTISHRLDAALTPIPAGAIDVRLRFTPDQPGGSDDAVLPSDFRLKGRLDLQIDAVPQVRGGEAIMTVRIIDHRGVDQGLDLSGTYISSFNGSDVNTTQDPDSAILTVRWTTGSDLRPSDYPLVVRFNGSETYLPSTGNGTIRMQGTIGATLNLGSDWTDGGATTWLSGQVFDDGMTGNPNITGNASNLTISLITAQGPVLLNTTQLDVATGAFNATIVMPRVRSVSTELFVDFDFFEPAPPGGPYYVLAVSDPPEPITIDAGVTSWSVIEANPSVVQVALNTSMSVDATVTDIADGSPIAGADVELILDFGGVNRSIANLTTDAEGNITHSFLVENLDPGAYALRLRVADDLTDALSDADAGRWYGNHTDVTVSVSVPTQVVVTNIPSKVTGGIDFQITGSVLDGDDSSRPLIEAVDLDVYWQDEPEELLLNGVSTSGNGTFTLTVPTDTGSDGTVRGARTLVVEVVEDSSEYYQPSNGTAVTGVYSATEFESLQPVIPVVIDRGTSIDMSAQLVESSMMFQPLTGRNVTVLFDDVWLPSVLTDGEGRANITYDVPLTQPLGPVDVTFFFNATGYLLETNRTNTAASIRSLTFIIIDPIVANPVAGTSFNVSGTLRSDNGSGLQIRDGTPLTTTVLITVDGGSTGFQVTGGLLNPDGTWNSTLTLDPSFGRGSHELTVDHISTVAYYASSRNNTSFDSRGTSTLTFIVPTTDSGGLPSLNDRIERGSNRSVRVLLEDNEGNPIEGASVNVSLVNGPDAATITTLTNGTGEAILGVPFDLDPGFMSVLGTYPGTNGTTGLLGVNGTTTFVVLAGTNLTLVSAPSDLIAGSNYTITGRLLDDLGAPLIEDGQPAGAILRLLIDGVEVATTSSDPVTGGFSFEGLLSASTDPGIHEFQVRFDGGRDWVDPIGTGEDLSPEFYLPSFDVSPFNASVPTTLRLSTPTGEVDRGGLMILEGDLVDLSENLLRNETIEILLSDTVVLSVQTGDSGAFQALVPIPSDQPLGGLDLSVRFPGSSFYLPSAANGTWVVFGLVEVTLDELEPVATGERLNVSGTVFDDLLTGLSNHELVMEVDGLEVRSLISGIEGRYQLDWLVPETLSDGPHILTIRVPAQGFYRGGSINGTFDVLHATTLTITVADGNLSRLRGTEWSLEGRLIDADDGAALDGADLLLELRDGVETVETFQMETDSTGAWAFDVPVEMAYLAGTMEFIVMFQGSSTHLPSQGNLEVEVWREVIITLDGVNPKVIRSEGFRGPFEATGRIQEVGGEGRLIASVPLQVGPVGCDANGATDCFDGVLLDWSNGGFRISGEVPSTTDIGPGAFEVIMDRNETLHAVRSTVIFESFVQVDAQITTSSGTLQLGDPRAAIAGSVTVVADDTGEGLEGVSIQVSLRGQNGTLSQSAGPTDESGRFTFTFDRQPYGAVDEEGEPVFGDLSLIFTIDDPRITNLSIERFQADGAGLVLVDLIEAEQDVRPPFLAIAGAILLIAAIGGVLLIRARSAKGLEDEMAEIFAYTAELLAAGDPVREVIFTCYEELVVSLRKREFLRRDGETVREFEAAIRRALPGVTEQSLLALDLVFEEARYSQHEMGETHAKSAQHAMSDVVTEVRSMEKIVPRI